MTTTTGAARPRLIRTLNEQLLLERMRANGPVSRSDLASVWGLSKPTVVPAGAALQLPPNVPGWERPAVLPDPRRLLGAETMIENDVDAAAVAEHAHGHGHDASTFAFVSVGTGIGMGLVLEGKLHRGAHGAAGEIAFLPLTDGELDRRDARRRGALESAVSSAAVVRAARRAGT